MEARVRRKILIGSAAAMTMVAAACWLVLRPVEPSWRGYPLSEWLDAYDSHNRFDEGDGRRSSFSDEEIERALKEMQPEALPILLKWLRQEQGGFESDLGRWLNQLPYVEVPSGQVDYQDLAVTGFMAYGPDARPVLPELLKLSHSPDPDLRMLAYESAFFTQPGEADFLPLVQRAMQEKSPGVRAMAAQWLEERLPAGAAERTANGK